MRHRRSPPKPRKDGYASALEAKYAEHLAELQQKGEILCWIYEPSKFNLANKCTYTPDFLVVTPEFSAYHEVKGIWRDDARVKWKTAAEKFWMFEFVAVTWDRHTKSWAYEIYDE